MKFILKKTLSKTLFSHQVVKGENDILGKKTSLKPSLLTAWILSLRFKPLIVGVGPVFVAVCLSVSYGSHFNWFLNGVIVFCVLCIQTATHFFNDVFDFLKGADSLSRKGPKRAVQTGLITPSQLFKAGVLCLFLSALGGIYLIGVGGWPIFAVGVISLALTYLYTGGPYPLAYKGLADLFVLLFFGLIPVSVVFYLNTGVWDISSFMAGLQCGLLALGLLLINNLRDEEEDRQADKKTLVVRWGRKIGAREWTVAHYLPYFICMYWFFTSPVFFLPLVLFPFSVYMHFLLYKAFETENLYGRMFAGSCLHYLLFVSLLCFSFLIGI